MKFILGISLTVIGFAVQAQTRQFIDKASNAIHAKDTTIEISIETPVNESYDFLSEGSERLNALFLSNLKKTSRNRPDELAKSATLSTLAVIATEAWKGSHYTDAKKWKNLSKYFRRAAQKSTSRFNLMKEISFRIPLVNNHGKKFYYDRKGSAGGLNLYEGSKPKIRLDEDDEDYVEPVPLDYFTETELIEKFEREIRKNRLTSDLKRGLYSYVGISVEIDERSLYKNRIPTARVVVVMGARRLQRVRPRKTIAKTAS